MFKSHVSLELRCKFVRCLFQLQSGVFQILVAVWLFVLVKGIHSVLFLALILARFWAFTIPLTLLKLLQEISRNALTSLQFFLNSRITFFTVYLRNSIFFIHSVILQRLFAFFLGSDKFAHLASHITLCWLREDGFFRVNFGVRFDCE